jgi:uncharacterized protein (TIGR02246 family)
MNTNKHVTDSSSSQQQQLGDETSVKNLVDRFVDVWNHYDAKAFASLLTEDGERTDVTGQTAIRRKEVVDMHIYPFTTAVLREAVLTLKSLRTKWIKDDVASIDVAWELTGHKMHDDGQSIPTTTRQGLTKCYCKKGTRRKWNMENSGWT